MRSPRTSVSVRTSPAHFNYIVIRSGDMADYIERRLSTTRSRAQILKQLQWQGVDVQAMRKKRGTTGK